GQALLMTSPAPAPTAITIASRSDRRRRLPARARIALSILVIGVAVATAACLPTATAPGGITGDVAAALNRDRNSAGLGGLPWNAQLGANAQNWANHIAATGALVHSDLGATMPGWVSLGENLFAGPAGSSAAGVEATWMGSAGHRANILSGSWNAIGIGAATDSSGQIWVVAE